MIEASGINTIGVPETVPDQLVAEVASQLAKLEYLHRDHPCIVRAQHVAALVAAVTCAMAKGEDGVIDAQFGLGTMEHVCAGTVDAAIWLLGRLFQLNHMDIDDVVLALPEYVKAVVTE